MPEGQAPENKYMTAEEASQKWHVKKRVVRRYCQEYCDFLGAYKDSGKWKIPVDAFPPYHTSELKRLLEAHLKALDNGRDIEGWDSDKALLLWASLHSAELVAKSDRPQQYVLTDKGWDFLLGRIGVPANSYASVQLNIGRIIEINLLKNTTVDAGPSASLLSI